MQGKDGGAMGKTPTADDIIALACWIKGDRVGRNERCPCGSGKKYKTCHYALQRNLYIQSQEVKRINEAYIKDALKKLPK